MTSLQRHLLFNFFENVNFSSSYKGLSAHQIWFTKSKVTEGHEIWVTKNLGHEKQS